MAQPNRNPVMGPYASRRNTYCPPARGHMVASSAHESAPVSVSTPARAHAISSHPGAPTSRVDSAEVMKIPEPIMDPITSSVASSGPSPRSRRASGSGVAGADGGDGSAAWRMGERDAGAVDGGAGSIQCKRPPIAAHRIASAVRRRNASARRVGGRGTRAERKVPGVPVQTFPRIFGQAPLVAPAHCRVADGPCTRGAESLAHRSRGADSKARLR